MSEYETNEFNFIGILFSITPNPLKGANAAEKRRYLLAAKVPFRDCPDYSGGFRGEWKNAINFSFYMKKM